MGQWRKVDMPLLVVFILFLTFGIVMVYSASFPYAYLRFDNASHYVNRQLFWAGVGLLCLLLALRIPYRIYGKLSPVLLLVTLLLLVLVLIPQIGIERNFSRRWLGLGGFQFQPVEIAKISLLIYFAYFYSRKQALINHFGKGVIPPLIVLVVVFGLILVQPDLGSATLIVCSCSVLLFFTKVRYRYLLFLMSFAVTGFIFFAVRSSYRLERLTSFTNPFADADGAGYQLVNSYISIHTGGVWGLGLGQSVQKLGYLPEAHTDFIMSIISEELGLLGVLIVVGFYLFLMMKGVQIGRRAPDLFGRLLAIGLTFQLLMQAIINLGAILGLLPITGITLPFVSYGGSSLMITMIEVGILLNISSYSQKSLSHNRNNRESKDRKRYKQYRKSSHVAEWG